MPELPEVETIARKLRSTLVGRTIVAVELLWERTVDRPAPGQFVSTLVGARIAAVNRRGKYLSLALADGRYLLVHLRMSGKFALRSSGQVAPDDPHTRVRIVLEDGTRLLFIDPRKFARFYLVDDPAEVLGALGPEPLDAQFTPEALRAAFQGRRSEIKRVLLDQTVLVGLGNIYANEALWRAHIHPRRAAAMLDAEEVQRLHRAIVDVLSEAVHHGGTSLEDHQYVYPDGGLGDHQVHLSVYDRAGEHCPRCGYVVERVVQGQRSTYYCPVCQPSEHQLGADSSSSSA